MRISSTRWLLAAAGAAGLLGVCAPRAAQQGSKPFTPEVDEFVAVYLKNGGKKLDDWVRADRTKPPDETLRAFKAVPGLSMELVASEPVIRQPVDLHFDDRGRLWVVQYLQYPFPAGLNITSYDQYLRARYNGVPSAPPNGVRGLDKITVLEDKDGDGLFESHQDVVTGLNITTSALTGRGGLWVMNPPYLLFYRDRTGDGLPDDGPEVKLAGFGLEDTHSLANSLTWGPDGWLYGVHGSTSTAKVRDISFLGQAVWRYHPDTDRFELFAQGGGNPWTLSFDSQGRAFSGDNGGNSRGFHWVRDGRYEKNWPKHGPFTRPHSYGYISNMDHEGYAARFAMTSVVYEDGKLPGHEGQLISGMALTSRIQGSRLVPDGSTFRTVDTDALVTTTERSFRPVDTAVGPDGAVYFADWCDIRMDHTDPRDTWDKSCGRIWRLRAKGSGPVAPFDLARRSSEELIALLGDGRKWYREQARRILGERKDPSLVPRLRRLAGEARGQLALEALWTANLIAGMDGQSSLALLDHPDPPVRTWALRLLSDDRSIAAAIGDRLVHLPRTESDAQVRSELANIAGRLDTSAALAVLDELIRRQEDIADRHIPLRIWWTLEARMATDADAVLNWLEESGLWEAPLFVGHLSSRIARRLAAERGDAPAFRRIDPEGDWKEYARHPRSLLPNRKGDYTDWETNYTPAISDRNLARLARLVEMAPVSQRSRLLAGAKAGLAQGAAAENIPTKLAGLLAEFDRAQGVPEDAGRTASDRGRTDFLTYCAPCHQTDGSGMDRLAKPLRGSKWVLGDEEALIRIALNGLRGELLMPPMGAIDDRGIAAILTYVRGTWGHNAGAVAPEAVGRVRAETRERRTPWTPDELSAISR